MTAPTITCPLAGCVADHGDGDNLHLLADTTVRDLCGHEMPVSGFVHPNADRSGVHVDGRELSTHAARDLAYALLAHADQIDLAVLQTTGGTR